MWRTERRQREMWKEERRMSGDVMRRENQRNRGWEETKKKWEVEGKRGEEVNEFLQSSELLYKGNDCNKRWEAREMKRWKGRWKKTEQRVCRDRGIFYILGRERKTERIRERWRLWLWLFHYCSTTSETDMKNQFHYIRFIWLFYWTV